MSASFDFASSPTDEFESFSAPEELKVVQALFGAANALEKAAENTSDSAELVQIAYAWIEVGRAWGRKSRDDIRRTVALSLAQR